MTHLPEEVDGRLVERDPDRGEHHQVQQDAEEEGNEPHEEEDGHGGLPGYQGPLLHLRPECGPSLMIRIFAFSSRVADPVGSGPFLVRSGKFSPDIRILWVLWQCKVV